MSKGYPDFFGYSIFPNYGNFQLTDSGAVIIPADSWGTIFNISAKGKIYSGYVGIQDLGLADTATIIARLTVDGDVMFSRSLDDLLNHGFVGDLDIPFSLTYYSKVNNFFVVTFPLDITFANSYKLEYFTDASAQIFVHGYLNWSRVL